MLFRRPTSLLLNIIIFCTFWITTDLPCTAQVYLMVGRNINGGGIQRYDVATQTLIGTFVSGDLLNEGTRGYDFGPDGNLYVSSQDDREIRKYDGKTGTFISNFAGDTSGYKDIYRTAMLFGPDGNLYVSGGLDNVVYRYDGVTGANFPAPGNSGAIFISGGGLNLAGGLAFGDNGDLYVGSYLGNALLRYNGATGAFKGTFISGLKGPSTFTFHNGDLYIVNADSNNVSRYDSLTGAFKGVFASSNLNYPVDLAFEPDGYLYVSSNYSNQIIRFDGTTGAFKDVFATVSSPIYLRFHDFGPTVPVSGNLMFEGIAGTSSAQKVTFEFRSLSGTDHIVRLATVPPNGDFSVLDIPEQNYTLHIKGDKYLAANVSVNTTNGNVSSVTANLLAGDANNDNSVDTSDFGILVGAYGSDASVPGSGYDARADFNGDGLLDTTDFGLLVGNYGASGAP